MEAKPESYFEAVFEKQVGNDSKSAERVESAGLMDGNGVCAICLEKIQIQETAIVKGCEHAYCTICILRWAAYKENPMCPQCKNPFESLNLHRSLDGCIQEHVSEESVFLLVTAAWFVPFMVETRNDACEEEEDSLNYYYDDDYEDDDDDDTNNSYFTGDSTCIRIGNRRWGDSGYVRAGRKEARPLNRRPSLGFEIGSSRQPKQKDLSCSHPPAGRRAKRAHKREAADKAAALKR